MARYVFDTGDLPTVTASFTDVDGAAADPTAVKVTTLSPNGTSVEYTDADSEVTNPSTGTWKFLFPTALTEEGTWRVRFEGTETLIAAAEQKFSVRETVFND